MGTTVAFAEHGTGGRLDRHDLDRRIFFLEIPADPGDGSTGAYPGYEEVHLLSAVRPYFRTGCCIVNTRVVGVLELGGNEGIGGVAGDFLSLGYRPFHP